MSSMFASKVERVNHLKEMKRSKIHRKSNSVAEMLKELMKPAIEDDSSSEADSYDNGVPGPGNYAIAQKVSDFNKTDVPERLQFFGSTVDRFKKKKIEHLIGPGSYNLKAPQGKPRAKGVLVPFACGDKRFKKKRVETVPGPGSYT